MAGKGRLYLMFCQFYQILLHIEWSFKVMAIGNAPKFVSRWTQLHVFFQLLWDMLLVATKEGSVLIKNHWKNFDRPVQNWLMAKLTLMKKNVLWEMAAGFYLCWIIKVYFYNGLILMRLYCPEYLRCNSRLDWEMCQGLYTRSRR